MLTKTFANKNKKSAPQRREPGRESNNLNLLHKNKRWIALQKETNYLKAADDCRSFLRLYQSQRGEIYQRLGIIYYFHIDDKEEAKTAFENSLIYDKYNHYTLSMLGRINEDLGDNLAAEEFFKKASAAGQFNKPLLGKFYLRRCRFEEAFETFATCNNILIAGVGSSYKSHVFLKGITLFLLGNESRVEIIDNRAKEIITGSGIGRADALYEIDDIRLAPVLTELVKDFVESFLE